MTKQQEDIASVARAFVAMYPTGTIHIFPDEGRTKNPTCIIWDGKNWEYHGMWWVMQAFMSGIAYSTREAVIRGVIKELPNLYPETVYEQDITRWVANFDTIGLSDGMVIDISTGLVRDKTIDDKVIHSMKLAGADIIEGDKRMAIGSPFMTVLGRFCPVEDDKLQFLNVAFGQALAGNPAGIILRLTGDGCDTEDFGAAMCYIVSSLLSGWVDDSYIMGKSDTDRKPPKETVSHTWAVPNRIMRFPFSETGKTRKWRTKFFYGVLPAETQTDWLMSVSGLKPRGMPVITAENCPPLCDLPNDLRERVRVVHFQHKSRGRGLLPAPLHDGRVKDVHGEAMAWLLRGLRIWHSTGKLPEYNDKPESRVGAKRK